MEQPDVARQHPAAVGAVAGEQIGFDVELDPGKPRGVLPVIGNDPAHGAERHRGIVDVAG